MVYFYYFVCFKSSFSASSYGTVTTISASLSDKGETHQCSLRLQDSSLGDCLFLTPGEQLAKHEHYTTDNVLETKAHSICRHL